MRIHFYHYDPGTQACRSLGSAFSAPSVSCNDNVLARHYQIGGPEYRIPDRLSCPVPVVEEIFALCVIDCQHRERQHSLAMHCFEAFDAGSGLFASSEYRRDEIPSLFYYHRNDIAAVINYYLRIPFEHFFNVF